MNHKARAAIAEYRMLKQGDRVAAAVSGGVNHTQEAVAALMVLGYTQAEALHAMEGLDAAGMEADEIIRQCLKKLVKS